MLPNVSLRTVSNSLNSLNTSKHRVPTDLAGCSPAAQSNTHCDRTDFLHSSRSRFHLGAELRPRFVTLCPRQNMQMAGRAWCCHSSYHGATLSIHFQYIILSLQVSSVMQSGSPHCQDLCKESSSFERRKCRGELKGGENGLEVQIELLD